VVIPAPRADGVLGLSGEFDWSGPGGALSALVRSYRGNARVVVDMAGVRYMDHRVLLALDEGAGAAGVLMLVRSAPPTVARLVGLLALDHLRIEAEAARR
jgi:anti-anti-sigma regulatory factor